MEATHRKLASSCSFSLHPLHLTWLCVISQVATMDPELVVGDPARRVTPPQWARKARSHLPFAAFEVKPQKITKKKNIKGTDCVCVFCVWILDAWLEYVSGFKKRKIYYDESYRFLGGWLVLAFWLSEQGRQIYTILYINIWKENNWPLIMQSFTAQWSPTAHNIS